MTSSSTRSGFSVAIFASASSPVHAVHDRVALDAEQVGEQLDVVRRVVDDQHLGWRGHVRLFLQRLAHGVQEFLQVDRLADVGVEARLGDLLAVLLHHRGGDRDDRDRRRRRVRRAVLRSASMPFMPGSWMSIRTRSGLCSSASLMPSSPVTGLERLVALDLQDVAHQLQVLLVVLDDQDRGSCVLPGG